MLALSPTFESKCSKIGLDPRKMNVPPCRNVSFMSFGARFFMPILSAAFLYALPIASSCSF